jgi:hypothetical protein
MFAVGLGMGWSAVAATLTIVPGASRHVFPVILVAPVITAVVVMVRAGETRLLLHSTTRAARRVQWWSLQGLALGVAALVGVYGASFKSDGLVHAAIIEKLRAFDSSTPGDLSLIGDGQPIASFIVPAWHYVLAFAVEVTGVDYPGLVAVWSASGAAAWLMIMVVAASGVIVTRRNSAAVWTAVLATLVYFVGWFSEAPDIVSTIGYPGNVVYFVVLPILLAVIAWAVGRTVRGEDPESLLVMSVVAATTTSIAVLHVTYAYYVVIAGAGMLAVSACVARSAIGLLVRAGALSAGILALAVILQSRVLANHSEFARGTGGAAGETVRETWDGLLVSGSFAIRPEWLLAHGGMYALALVAAALIIPLTRGRALEAVLLIVVPTALYIGAMRSGPIAELVAGLGSFPPVSRTPRAIPAALALIVAMVAIDDVLVRRFRGAKGTRIRWITAMGGAVFIILVAPYGPSNRMGRDHVEALPLFIPGWLVDVLLVVLLAQIVWLMWAGWRAREYGWGISSVEAEKPVGIIVSVSCIVMVAVATFAWLPDVRRAAGAREHTVLASSGIDPSYIRAREVRPGALVLAVPDDALRFAAVSPVYVAGTSKHRLQDAERTAKLKKYMDEDVSSAWRSDLLAQIGVDAVFLPIQSDYEARIEERPSIERDIRERWVEAEIFSRMTIDAYRLNPASRRVIRDGKTVIVCVLPCSALDPAVRKELKVIE